MLAITIVNLNVQRYGYLSFLMCFVWGWLDGSLNIHVNQNLGFQFDTVSEPFACLGMLSGIGVFTMELILGAVNIDKSAIGIQIYAIGLGCYGLIACSITFFFPYRSSVDPAKNRENLVKGFDVDEPFVAPYIPTPEISKKDFKSTEHDDS